jgi:cytochrome c
LVKFVPFDAFPIGAVVLAVTLAVQGSPTQAASPIRGELLFLKCASCHDISTSPSAKTGPNLHGVFGRRVGSLPGYAYSPAMQAQSFVWDASHLDRWLTQPTDLIPGTAMAFGGLSSKADRDAVISYLRGQAN